MPNVLLIHWDPNGLDERAERLERAGFDVAMCSKDGSAAFRAVGAAAPHAVVIDLSRQPSHGKRLALALKEKRTTRHIPIVFVDGTDDAVATLREALPDSTYVGWRAVGGALKRAIAAATKDDEARSAIASSAEAPAAGKARLRRAPRV
jgi:CheY-like chemotaxis protein